MFKNIMAHKEAQHQHKCGKLDWQGLQVTKELRLPSLKKCKQPIDIEKKDQPLG